MENKIDALELKIQTAISNTSSNQFEYNIKKLNKYISNDVKYIIINLFVQIGQQEGKYTEENYRALEYKNKNDITLYIQPKIKNYITFKSKESAIIYRNEELSDDDLYLFLEVQNGKIII